ncbi:NAD(+) diphosphatase [Citricoccus sp. SGAir0253]|uniref:NAD(+) diphosphatase n=1 Tax=Citricoccus sp. SGAir0253 TaxID=2567881 RepID=UPI0010CD58C0|nr:NAD(+) diphosphatase [Citricoccus sp. SGAir0253]QCU77727.1 NAD(+) diphosphatase [Citricoccus sp. SGAir0253]
MRIPDETLPALGRLPLAREDVDRGCEVRAEPGWLQRAWARPEARVLWLTGGRAPVLGGRLVLDRPQGELPGDAVYLGRSAAGAGTGTAGLPADGDAARAELILLTAERHPELAAPEAGGAAVADPGQVAWVGLRDVAAALTDRDAGIFVEAVSIANWHATHTHCPRCGERTVMAQSGWVRVCPADSSEHFPRTDPAIIVAITDREDRILLGNNTAWGPGRFSTLAGFVEPGESLEAAVVREIHEESQLVVHSPQYLGSQPWPFPQSLMLGFSAVTDDPDAAAADGEELAEVRWFTREQLRAAVAEGHVTIPGATSISRALIEHWFGGDLPEPRTLHH